MDYNQQRRTRNSNYNRGRQMNYGRQEQNNCGCTNCSGENYSVSVENDCGCQQERGCDRRRERDRGCRENCTYMRQKGCLEESSAYPVGMSYTPWQSWGSTYDGHRALMSGTIFPELDKPFCAAGRCGR